MQLKISLRNLNICWFSYLQRTK